MLKKIIAICITVMILCTSLFTAIPVSAATGIDISETFEFYGSMDGVDPSDLVRTFWVTSGCLANKNSIDETKSAPNRGNGKGPGNYRSMKVDVKFFSGPDGTWGTFRFNTHEDWAAVKDGIERMDKSLAFSFWADVEKEMVLEAGIDINNVPYDKDITLTPGWKKYTLKLDELKPQIDKYGEGTGIFEVQEMVKKGEGGWKYPFFCGFKFGVKADWQEVQENTIWIDTIAIEGDTITERTEYKVEVGDTIYQTELDEDGPVPKNFVSDNKNNTTSSNKNNTTSSNKNNATSSNKNNTTSSNKNNATSSNKNNATSSNKNNTTSSNTTNTTTSNNNVTTSTVIGNGTTSTIVDNNTDTTDTTVSDVTNSNETSTDVNNNQNVDGSADNNQEIATIDKELLLVIILAAVLILVIVIVILLVVRKRRKNRKIANK